MIARIKQNRQLQKFTRDRYKRVRKLYENEKAKRVGIAQPDMSDEELVAFRKELRARIRKQKVREQRIFLLALLVGVVVVAILFLALRYLFLYYPN